MSILLGPPSRQWARQREVRTNSVEMNDNRPISFDHCRFASQRHHFAEDAYRFVGKGSEIFGVDTRSGFRRHFEHGWRRLELEWERG